MNHFDSLPNELIVKIFEHFDFTQLKFPDLQLACKRFHSLCRHPALQKELRIPSDLKVIQLLLALQQRPSIKTLTIVECSLLVDEESIADSLLRAPFGVTLPFGCIYVQIDEFVIPYMLKSECLIHFLSCVKLKTFGTFHANSKNFISNLRKLQIWERIMDNDLINIANCSSNLQYLSIKGCFSQYALDSLTQCEKLTELVLRTNCDKFEIDQLSKEKLPFLKSLALADDEEEVPTQLRNLENWFHNQNFSHLTELDLDIFNEGPRSLLLNICNNCPNLIKLVLRGELFGGTDNLRLLRQLQLLQTFVFQTPDMIWSHLDTNNFHKMLRLYENGVTKMERIEMVISMDGIPNRDIRRMKRTAKKRGIYLQFVQYSQLDLSFI